MQKKKAARAETAPAADGTESLKSQIGFNKALVLSSTLTYTSSYLNSVLSAEFIAEVREVLRQLFGTESVFASLQMLGAVSVFLFSFASCAFCIFGACVFFMHTELKVQGEVKEFEEKDVDLPDGICVRRFAVFSRYLI